MKDNNKEDLKVHVLGRIDKINSRISSIKYMLRDIQSNDFHLHFCFNGEVTFGGEAEKIENNLLMGYEKHVIGRLKHILKEEQNSLDYYNRILTGKDKK